MGRHFSTLLRVAWCAAARALVAPACPGRPGAPRRARTVVRMGRGATGMAHRRVDESRRQARVAQQVRSELATIIRSGHFLVKTGDRVDVDALRNTAVLDVDVSPDLSVATATVTTRGDVAAKREAFAWLVKNEVSVRYALAKRLRHAKRVPEVTFRKADASGATRLMSLIDRAADDAADGSDAPAG